MTEPTRRGFNRVDVAAVVAALACLTAVLWLHVLAPLSRDRLGPSRDAALPIRVVVAPAPGYDRFLERLEGFQQDDRSGRARVLAVHREERLAEIELMVYRTAEGRLAWDSGWLRAGEKIELIDGELRFLAIVVHVGAPQE